MTGGKGSRTPIRSIHFSIHTPPAEAGCLRVWTCCIGVTCSSHSPGAIHKPAQTLWAGVSQAACVLDQNQAVGWKEASLQKCWQAYYFFRPDTASLLMSIYLSVAPTKNHPPKSRGTVGGRTRQRRFVTWRRHSPLTRKVHPAKRRNGRFLTSGGHAQSNMRNI